MCDSSTIAHYTAEKVKATQLVFPSLHEQTQIANFLDQKTAQIDRLIEQKEKLLKLLAEKRTAIITQAVTKGLDPDVEMKDSGIDWLGEIPKHWGAKPLKHVVALINEKLDELGDLPYLGLEHIESWTSKRIVDINARADGVVSRFQSNDVLFGKLRPYLAKVYLANFEGGASTEALVLRGGGQVVPEFLKYFLGSDLLIDVINSSTYGSKMPRASWNFIGHLPMVLPHTDVQKEIVIYLSDKVEKIGSSIFKIQKSINHLKEYREALITAAVTGQIDVRKEVINE
jgi:restriction endonuclease S subunit